MLEIFDFVTYFTDKQNSANLCKLKVAFISISRL